MAATRFRQGQQIGPYTLLQHLGRGAFGEVWLAERAGSIARTKLAVKLPIDARVGLDDVRQEATLWARAGPHPNVMPVFEAHVYDGQVVIASEYAAEGSLADWLARQGVAAPSAEAAVGIGCGILRGLEHLHGCGIVHRDVKPANVLMQGGLPRLADFGLARLLDPEATVSRVSGTPAYMAPEAFDGERSVPSDLWSAAVVLYELLTGTLPFRGKGATAVFRAVVSLPPEALPDSVPPPLGAVLFRALEKDPGRRFPSAGDMLAALEGALAVGPQAVSATATLRLATHWASFHGSRRVALFINATNLSRDADLEITHVWLETRPAVHVVNPERPLPKRLRPQETWETWVDLGQLPTELLSSAETYALARARLSTGCVVHSVRGENVPEMGFVPGGPAAQFREAVADRNARETTAPADTASPKSKRKWWKFW
jgi:serine/threonine-protein kinase